jgi:hypothetical protein
MFNNGAAFRKCRRKERERKERIETLDNLISFYKRWESLPLV